MARELRAALSLTTLWMNLQQLQRAIASEGGRTAHEKRTAHAFTSEEARQAGRKGGLARSGRAKARLAGSSSGVPK